MVLVVGYDGFVPAAPLLFRFGSSGMVSVLGVDFCADVHVLVLAPSSSWLSPVVEFVEEAETPVLLPRVQVKLSVVS
jgi:hypothetical protein